jgi:hypothetical protein
MIDKELIAMSNCKEIQDRWEPKVGDRVWSKLHECYATVIEIEGNGVMHLRADDGSPIWRVIKDEVLYIPRIEDVLEWLTCYEFSINVDRSSRWGIIHAESDWYEYPIKALLEAYMYLEHNKTWNGEAWS